MNLFCFKIFSLIANLLWDRILKTVVAQKMFGLWHFLGQKRDINLRFYLCLHSSHLPQILVHPILILSPSPSTPSPLLSSSAILWPSYMMKSFKVFKNRALLQPAMSAAIALPLLFIARLLENIFNLHCNVPAWVHWVRSIWLLEGPFLISSLISIRNILVSTLLLSTLLTDSCFWKIPLLSSLTRFLFLLLSDGFLLYSSCTSP